MAQHSLLYGYAERFNDIVAFQGPGITLTLLKSTDGEQAGNHYLIEVRRMS
jgi:hypothetical protein